MKTLNIVITSGGTSEYIDVVRKITNSGTGKLGSIIAEQISKNENINKIFYIYTTKAILPNNNFNNIEYIEVKDTNSVKIAIENVLKNNKIDYFIHSMAISDYYVDYVTNIDLITKQIDSKISIENILKNPNETLDNSSKLSSNEDNLIIKLKRTPKIISIIKSISPSTFLVGFKLLDNVSREKLLDTAIKLRDKNKCDLVVANDLNTIRNGAHQAYIIRSDNSYLVAISKDDIAEKIIEEMHID